MSSLSSTLLILSLSTLLFLAAVARAEQDEFFGQQVNNGHGGGGGSMFADDDELFGLRVQDNRNRKSRYADDDQYRGDFSGMSGVRAQIPSDPRLLKKFIGQIKKRAFFDDDDQLFSNFNLGCTIQCGAYWRCFYKDVRNGGDGTACNQPSGCNCNSFARDDDDELFGKFGRKISKGFKKGKKLYKKGRKIYGKYKKYRGLLGVDDDDEFLNWGKVNLGCTIQCGSYWRCFYKDLRNGGDGTACNQPSGCNCNSFADDDDELFGKFGRKISKGFKKGKKLYKKGRKIYGKYKKYRGLLGVDDDDQGDGYTGMRISYKKPQEFGFGRRHHRPSRRYRRYRSGNRGSTRRSKPSTSNAVYRPSTRRTTSTTPKWVDDDMGVPPHVDDDDMFTRIGYQSGYAPRRIPAVYYPPVNTPRTQPIWIDDDVNDQDEFTRIGYNGRGASVHYLD